jgi:hypothetical protein
MRERFPLGSVASLFFDLIVSGQGQTGQTPTIAIQRVADRQWFNAAVGAFQPPYVEASMSELDAAAWPGRYVFEFDHSRDDLVSPDFLVRMSNPDPAALRYREVSFGSMSSVAEPHLCSIQGTLFGPDGRPRPGELVQATLIPVLTDGLGRGYEADAIVDAYTAQDGSFDLPFVRGATIRLEIRAIGYDRRALVPDQPSVLFTGL